MAEDRCSWPEPPADVARWVHESWKGALSSNIASRQDWLLDGLVKGQGTLALCVRWGATTTFTTAVRDQIAASMRTFLEGWLGFLEGDGCYPYPQGVTVTISGIAVRPGQESLLEWTDRAIPVYTDTDPSSDPAGEPTCPDSCSFSSHWDHRFPDCPGGEQNHFDYVVWLDDALPGGAIAVGSGWGLRMPAGHFARALGAASNPVIQQVMGFGFGMPVYADWTGSLPSSGALITGTAIGPPTVTDGWLLRRIWIEQRSLRRW